MINQLPPIKDIEQHKNALKIYEKLTGLIDVLNTKELPESLISTINNEIAELNNFEETLRKKISLTYKKYSKICSLLEKEMKWVVPNHYRNLWLVLGMSVFGIPFGVIFSASIDNYGLMGCGLPIGMLIGIVIGSAMDKKALQEGRQLSV